TCFEERAGDGGERCDRDKDGGAGGAPGRAVFGEATAGHDVREGRGVLAVPAPRMQDPGATWEVRPDATLLLGAPCEGCRRGVDHGGVPEAWRRAEQGAQGGRDGAGEQAVRPGQRFVQGMLEPLL